MKESKNNCITFAILVHSHIDAETLTKSIVMLYKLKNIVTGDVSNYAPYAPKHTKLPDLFLS